MVWDSFIQSYIWVSGTGRPHFWIGDRIFWKVKVDQWHKPHLDRKYFQLFLIESWQRLYKPKYWLKRKWLIKIFDKWFANQISLNTINFIMIGIFFFNCKMGCNWPKKVATKSPNVAIFPSPVLKQIYRFFNAKGNLKFEIYWLFSLHKDFTWLDHVWKTRSQSDCFHYLKSWPYVRSCFICIKGPFPRNRWTDDSHLDLCHVHSWQLTWAELINMFSVTNFQLSKGLNRGADR